MHTKIFTTNDYGFYCEREVFSGQMLSGIETATVSEQETCREFLGYGAAITGSSCYNLSRMEAGKRETLLKDLYSEEGLHMGIGRLTIGASDYSPVPYSYDDVAEDTELVHFSIDPDREYIIPMIKEILKINPQIKLFASPWSPPAWMKTGASLGGGFMREKYLECYARYFVKFILAYEKEGIPIYAVTLQNETLTDQVGKMPACIWHPETEAKFVSILHEEFAKNHILTKIWFHDHNFSAAANKVDWCLTEYPLLQTQCDGIAFHYYHGGIEQTACLKKRYPSLSLHFTEGGPRLYDHYDSDWCKWGQMLIKALNHGYSSFTGWNLMLDETGGPNIGPFFCGGLVTGNSQDHSVSYSGQYKAFRHFTDVTPESRIYPLRITDPGSHMSNYPNGEAYLPEGCMICNPDGKKCLVLVNPMKTKSQIQFLHDGVCRYIELLPNTLATVLL